MDEITRRKYIEETEATIPKAAVAEPPEHFSFDLAPDVVTVAATRADGGLTVSRFIVQEYRAPTRKEIREGAPMERVPLGRPREITPELIDSIYARRLEPAKGRKPGDAVVSWEIVPNDFSDDSTDRTYRNAWKKTPGLNKPDHDMPKARDIHREYLRNARQPELDALDIDYQRADERSDQQAKQNIVARKQKLRDVPADPRIEAAQTVEELKALTLSELTK